MKAFLTNYQTIIVTRSTGGHLTIFLNDSSGQIFYRYKINSISKIPHPAIYLGNDIHGNQYFIHNHYEVGYASIVSKSVFSKGQRIYRDERGCQNTPKDIIRIGLRYVNNQIRYDWLSDNCQTLTSNACNNIKQSESINNWAKGLALFALVAIVIKASS